MLKKWSKIMKNKPPKYDPQKDNYTNITDLLAYIRGKYLWNRKEYDECAMMGCPYEVLRNFLTEFEKVKNEKQKSFLRNLFLFFRLNHNDSNDAETNRL